MNGFAFKIKRLAVGFTQWELARQADIPPYRISAFECGRVALTNDEIERLEDSLAEAAASEVGRGA